MREEPGEASKLGKIFEHTRGDPVEPSKPEKIFEHASIPESETISTFHKKLEDDSDDEEDEVDDMGGGITLGPLTSTIVKKRRSTILAAEVASDTSAHAKALADRLASAAGIAQNKADLQEGGKAKTDRDLHRDL